MEPISYGQSQFSTFVWCHSCLKMPMQLPYSTVSWIWSRKLWNSWIQIRGRVVEWFWMAKRNHKCWYCITWPCRIFCESILTCQDKPYPGGYSCSAAYFAAVCLPFLCVVWAWSCCQLRTMANTDGDDDVELHVLGCRLTYWRRDVTSAEACFSVALRPQKP